MIGSDSTGVSLSTADDSEAETAAGSTSPLDSRFTEPGCDDTGRDDTDRDDEVRDDEVRDGGR
jgi:hypothetical protein